MARKVYPALKLCVLIVLWTTPLVLHMAGFLGIGHTLVNYLIMAPILILSNVAFAQRSKAQRLGKELAETRAHLQVVNRRHDLLLANLTYAFEDYGPYLSQIDSDPSGPGWLTPVVAINLPVGRVLIPFDPTNAPLFEGLPQYTDQESMADYHATNHRLEAMRYN